MGLYSSSIWRTQGRTELGDKSHKIRRKTSFLTQSSVPKVVWWNLVCLSGTCHVALSVKRADLQL